jgi:hypothetical protein
MLGRPKLNRSRVGLTATSARLSQQQTSAGLPLQSAFESHTGHGAHVRPESPHHTDWLLFVIVGFAMRANRSAVPELRDPRGLRFSGSRLFNVTPCPCWMTAWKAARPAVAC